MLALFAQGVFVQGVYVPGAKCAGDRYPGGKCSGTIIFEVSVQGVHVLGCMS